MTKLFLMLMMVSVWSGCGKEVELVRENKNGVLYEEYEVYRDETNKQLVRHGFYRQYYPNKSYKEERNYKDGKLDGKWVSYWENGQIQTEGNWKDGKQDGKLVVYDKNGQILIERYYKDGERID